MKPEFSRPVRLDTIGERGRPIEIAADAGERAALAKRFGLLALDRLAAEGTVAKTAAGIRAAGRITAAVAQACVATGEPVAAKIDAPFDLVFVAERDLPHADEVELDSGDLEVLPHDGLTIDLGEAAAQTLALALDPFPRAPHAEAVLREAGVLTEEQASPFAALAGLKDKLGG